jgi:predicted peptidase
MMLYLLGLLPASYLGLMQMQSVGVLSFQAQPCLDCRRKNNWNTNSSNNSNYSSKISSRFMDGREEKLNNDKSDGISSSRAAPAQLTKSSLYEVIPQEVTKSIGIHKTRNPSQHHERRGFLSRTLMGLGLGSTATVSSFLLPSTSTDASAATILSETRTSDLILGSSASQSQRKSIIVKGGTLTEVNDPQTYPALVYQPEPKPTPDLEEGVVASTNNMNNNNNNKLPVLVVLHGAGKNELDVWNLADIRGEHAGLIPSLLASGKAPPELYENFIVIAPYSIGKASFYDEPRSKLLQCIRWACDSHTTSTASPQQGSGNGTTSTNKDIKSVTVQGIDTDRMDLSRVYLFGFSDGATLGIELMTTRKFAAGIFAAYGFTGKLPKLALERMQDLPMWIFHSQDDVIFPVKCSDQLVKDLRAMNINSNTNANTGKGNDTSIVRYSRFQQDQEGFTGSVKGHSTGITASRNPEVYKWLLSL